jgi:hypothetical protein
MEERHRNYNVYSFSVQVRSYVISNSTFSDNFTPQIICQSPFQYNYIILIFNFVKEQCLAFSAHF